MKPFLSLCRFSTESGPININTINKRVINLKYEVRGTVPTKAT